MKHLYLNYPNFYRIVVLANVKEFVYRALSSFNVVCYEEQGWLITLILYPFCKMQYAYFQTNVKNIRNSPLNTLIKALKNPLFSLKTVFRKIILRLGCRLGSLKGKSCSNVAP
jgi:hypothetical protein